jgi:hypothetical protein
MLFFCSLIQPITGSTILCNISLNHNNYYYYYYYYYGYKCCYRLCGQERGPLSLVSTTEELLDKKVAAPV